MVLALLSLALPGGAAASSADPASPDLPPAAAAEMRQAREAAARGQPKLAFDHAGRALGLAPTHEEALRLHAVLGLEAGLAMPVAASVEALARRRPDDGFYAYLVGRVWLGLGDTRQAAEALERSIELAPDHLPTRRALGVALVAESRFAEARSHLEPVVAADPDDLDAAAALAVAEERLGEPTVAERRATEILARAPRHAMAHLVLGMVRIRAGELAAARTALEAAVAADPLLAKAHYQLSLACGRLGDRACAERHRELYRRALAGPEAAMGEMTRVSPAPPDDTSDDGS